MQFIIAGFVALAVTVHTPAHPVHTKAELRRIHRANPACSTWKCVTRVKVKIRNKEWRFYKSHPLTIPTCTWSGESGPGPQFAKWRYRLHYGHWFGPPPAHDGDAYGKYQMMKSTYEAHAKYGDWSPLDQEIAAHRLFQDDGTRPWQAC